MTKERVLDEQRDDLTTFVNHVCTADARGVPGPTAHILSLILELEFPNPAANFRPSLRYPLSASSRCGLFSWLWDRRVVFPTPRPAAHQARRVGPKHTA